MSRRHIPHLIALLVVFVVCSVAFGTGESPPPGSVLVAYEPVDFVPCKLDPSASKFFALLSSKDLERTPRDYVRAAVTVRSTGRTTIRLVVADMLRRQITTPPLQAVKGRDAEIRLDMNRVATDTVPGYGIAMPSAIALRVEGSAFEVLSIKLYCAVEKLPEPDVVVKGPLDDTSIQAALDSLPEHGGVVYIPAGKYIINETVTIPRDNITIYGDGHDTIIQGTWPQSQELFYAENRKNLRLSRLHFASLPITAFRGYSEKAHAETPEDAEKYSVTSRGFRLAGCENVRIDHCEIELFGHCGICFYGGKANLVDHCFLHENFRYGYGYGVATPGTTELYIEDNNFENHRHGIAGNAGGASYIARFNRLVKYAAEFPSWNQSAKGINQLRAHEIDAHAKCGWIYAHDNYVAMYDAVMGGAAMMRGNPGWLYRNVWENCSPGIYCVGNSDDVWTWDNISLTECAPDISRATGEIHFDQKPDNFNEFPYPHQLNHPGGWPGAEEASATIVKAETQFAGPKDVQVLQLVPDAK